MPGHSKSYSQYVQDNNLIPTLLDCVEGRHASETELQKLRGSMERAKCEMQRVSQELYGIRSDVSGLADELVMLEDSLAVANKNSGGLQISLSKLKSKVGTHRVRATGAVCD